MSVPSGLSVRYTAQGVPISPWLKTYPFTYSIAQDSAWLSTVKDGVLDLNLQVMGSNRMLVRPWPAFLHLKRGNDLSPLVPIMVGDNPTSMGPRVAAVTRVTRTDRKASGKCMRRLVVFEAANSLCLFKQKRVGVHLPMQCICDSLTRLQ